MAKLGRTEVKIEMRGWDDVDRAYNLVLVFDFWRCGESFVSTALHESFKESKNDRVPSKAMSGRSQVSHDLTRLTSQRGPEVSLKSLLDISASAGDHWQGTAIRCISEHEYPSAR